jgi:hypothetical protein
MAPSKEWKDVKKKKGKKGKIEDYIIKDKN